MGASVNIPDTQYRRLKAKAEREGTTVRHVVLRCIDKELESGPEEAAKTVKRFTHPVLPSTRADKLEITNEQIYDLIGFP